MLMQDTTSCSSTQQAIAGAVRAAMARRKCSQKSLRTALGWSVSFLGRRVSGEVDFSVSELVAVAQAIGVDPAELLSSAVADSTKQLAAA